MPLIRVVNRQLGRERETDAPSGGALADICDEARLPVPFSCRSASCATCHVRVATGANLLEQADAEELELLDFIGAPAGSRLACQVRVKAGDGTVVLEPL